MKRRSRFSEEQIIGILKEHEAGVSVADLCRKHGVSDALAQRRDAWGECNQSVASLTAANVMRMQGT
ncbi:transposase-like protein [Bradyrhizobium sp. USDA 372]|uniref:Transposase n=1 Tax=Bradyrhizobium yuanmingense TaxID=108015 RepID=A0A1C3XLB1_9BRAD|nr:transposase [Bradyrhizobium sp. CB1015]TWI16621.1 transposase [Bradyrhizobium yuanmingense]UWU93593.1 transposase [Bradyrhizobium sp. CB1015]SCB53009.1 Transposase [Bradyrhizobium yuanmingense]